ncbi:MAG: sugar nucleotide-binding protein, partial [Cycloclasticus sp.]|nr:sugar nucleotide-binding protein [Cycloclasticus sp.]
CNVSVQKQDSLLMPIGAYAQGKAYVEEACRDDQNVTIARLPKILDVNSGLLRTWVEDLNNGNEIIVFKNMMVSPVSLHYAARFIVALMKEKIGGVWHISGDCDVSYFDVACALCKVVGANGDLVVAQNVESTQKFALPKHPRLDCAMTEQKLGIGAQKLSELLADYFPVFSEQEECL